MTMTMESTLSRAQSGDEDAFRALTEPHRRELQLHCYRMLGSLQDAEDAVQETLVSAWRGLRGFEERASLRSWLYSIATNRCLNALRDRARRPRAIPPLPFEVPEPTRHDALPWLQPYPDLLLDGLPDEAPGPDARYETREAVGLAFIAAVQRLPDRQRAVLVLRDVLGFRAAEVARMLETSEATVNSALQRARASLEARMPPARERALAPGSAREAELAGSFADAFEAGDVDRIVSLLTEDAWVTMPPQPLEYQGLALIREFFMHVWHARRAGSRSRLLPTRANGLPAFAHYMDDSEGVLRGMGILVLDVTQDGIVLSTRFGGAELVRAFGFEEVIDG